MKDALPSDEVLADQVSADQVPADQVEGENATKEKEVKQSVENEICSIFVFETSSFMCVDELCSRAASDAVPCDTGYSLLENVVNKALCHRSVLINAKNS